MLSLEEIAKVNNLIATCNEMIEGKFILADYKIASILKSITASQEVYHLLEKCLNGYNFEKDFRTAELKTTTEFKKFTIPTEPERVLPFVFCLLVSIKNKTINFDAFLKEFYPSKNGRAEEYTNFAKDIVLPFRNIIANYFDIPLEKAEKLTSENIADFSIKKEEKPVQEHQANEEKKEERKNYDDDDDDYADEEDDDDNNCEDDDGEDDDGEDENENLHEISQEQIEQFLLEVKSISSEIVLELKADRKLKPEVKEDYIYIINTLIYSCEQQDLHTVLAFITSLSYILKDVKSTRFLTRELKRILIDFYS